MKRYAIKQPDGSSRVLEKDIHRILGIAVLELAVDPPADSIPFF